MTWDPIINGEHDKLDNYREPDWRGLYWTRELVAFGPVVRLVQWSGGRYDSTATGREIYISFLRYWWLLKQVRRSRSIPRATLVLR